MGNFFWKKLYYLFPTIIGFLIITFLNLCVNFFEVRFLEGRCVKMPPPSIFFKIPPPYHPKKSAFSLLFWISQILHPTFFSKSLCESRFFPETLTVIRVFTFSSSSLGSHAPFFWKTKKTPGGRKFPLTCCHFFIFSFEKNDDHSSVFFIFKKVLENHTKKWNKNWFYVCSGGVFFLTKMENCAENMHYWRKRFVWQREFGAKNSQISQDFEKKRRMLWPRIAKKYW